MKVTFKYPRTLDGKHFAPGIHEVADRFAVHWFFKALVTAGDVEIFMAEEPCSSVSSPESSGAENAPEPHGVSPKSKKKRGSK